MHEPSGDRAGQLIGGKYRIEALLARGGMGLIYAARHSGTGRAVAIKILRPELAARNDLVRRVSAEARLAVEASHPNVVEVLDAGADDTGIPYVVLERLHGKPLDAFIDSPIALLPAVQALLPISNALVSLHQAGIVHRDIKPSNIFLSRLRDGRVTPKLLDFGIAKALEGTGMTLSGTALGTPAYMAPEQALGAGDAGPATDVWSIAVVFVRCLTGRLPFEAQPQRRLGSLRAGLQAADLELVPAPLRAALTRALRFEPSERFATMEDLRAALLSALPAIDARGVWPRADTVSYASEATPLASWLGELPAEDSVPADASSSLRRPAEIETRTMPAEPRATSAARLRPATSTRALLALAALGALAIASRFFMQQSFESTALPARPQPRIESLALAPAALHTVLHEAEEPLPQTEPEPPAGAAPSHQLVPPDAPGAHQPGSSTAGSTPAPAPRPTPAKDAKALEADSADGSTTSSKPAFGANRARIIE